MTSWARLTLEERVTRAAEAALADHHYVSALDIFVGMGLLAPAHVLDWRNGRIERAYRTYYVSPESPRGSRNDYRRASALLRRSWCSRLCATCGVRNARPISPTGAFS